MQGINKVILVGYLGRDPELRSVGSGSKAQFSLATGRAWTDKQGNRQDRTQWHRVVTWGNLAEAVARLGAKGRLAYVEGMLETREFEQNGEKQRVTEVNARVVEFLDKSSGPRDEAPAAKSQPARPPADYRREPGEDRDDGGQGWGPPLADQDIPF